MSSNAICHFTLVHLSRTVYISTLLASLTLPDPILGTVGCLFSRATNFADFMDFSHFHEIYFAKNYWKFYRDMDCRLKRNVGL